MVIPCTTKGALIKVYLAPKSFIILISSFLTEIPIEIAIREGGDAGKPVSFYAPESVSAKRYEQAATRLWEIIQKIDEEELAGNSAIQPDMSTKAHHH